MNNITSLTSAASLEIKKDRIERNPGSLPRACDPSAAPSPDGSAPFRTEAREDGPMSDRAHRRSRCPSLLRGEGDSAVPFPGNVTCPGSRNASQAQVRCPRHWSGVDLAEGSPEDDTHDADVTNTHGEAGEMRSGRK